MASVTDIDVVDLARSLIDIDSTTPHEGPVAQWLAKWLRGRGHTVDLQQVEDDRVNLYTGPEKPVIVLSTHLDCVPPFFPSRVEGDLLYGRGACDAKGIAAAQIVALECLRAERETRVGALFVVGEERGSHGAHAANRTPRGSHYLINGEPTGSRLAAATRGVYRARLRAQGRAAHSSHPEEGISAIEKLVDALVALRAIALPSTPELGVTSYTVALLDGGVAPNVIPPHASAEINFRTVGPASTIRTALTPLERLVEIDDVVEVPPVTLTTVQGFETTVCAFTTDIPFLNTWGNPLLFGPGSVLVAHTAEEHVRIDELRTAVGHYTKLTRILLQTIDA